MIDIRDSNRRGWLDFYRGLDLPFLPGARALPDGTCSCLKVFPRKKRCPSPGKHPLPANPAGRGNGYSHATTDAVVHASFWNRRDAAETVNIVLPTGRIGGFFVVDVDVGFHADGSPKGGEEGLAGLEAEHGALPPTWEARTGSGGRHILFQHPGDEVRIPNSVGKLAPGVDIRGDGGIIVAPGGVHKSGGVYEIVCGFGLDDVPLADAPEWLLEKVQKKRVHFVFNPPLNTELRKPNDWGRGFALAHFQFIGLDLRKFANDPGWNEEKYIQDWTLPGDVVNEIAMRVQAELDRIRGEVRALVPGERDSGIYQLSAKVGNIAHLLPGGEGEAYDVIADAAGDVFDPFEHDDLIKVFDDDPERGTIHRGLNKGLQDERGEWFIRDAYDRHFYDRIEADLRAGPHIFYDRDGNEVPELSYYPAAAPLQPALPGPEGDGNATGAPPSAAAPAQEPLIKPLAENPRPTRQGISRPVHRSISDLHPEAMPRRQGPAAGAARAPEPSKPIHATPWEWVEPSAIPVRKWIYGKHYIRKFVSATVASPGIGKSSLSITEMLAIATGRDLLGIKPLERTNIWIFNLEDPGEELSRRIAAACSHHGIEKEEISGRLFVDSGRTQKLCVTKKSQSGRDFILDQDVIVSIKATIQKNNIGVLIIDPFVSVHGVPENDNGAIDMVVKAFADIADACNCSIELVHHVRKGVSGQDKDVEDTRGAGSLIGAARSVRVLNAMNEHEAARFGINPDERFGFVKISDGKGNMAPRSGLYEWFRLISVGLGNGEGDMPACNDRGPAPEDFVGVMEKWAPPEGLDLTEAQVEAIRRTVEEGDYRVGSRTGPTPKAWIGHAIGEICGFDVATRGGKIAAQTAYDALIKANVLVEREDVASGGTDRHPHWHVRLGTGQWEGAPM